MLDASCTVPTRGEISAELLLAAGVDDANNNGSVSASLAFF